jgi:hypothetical protein
MRKGLRSFNFGFNINRQISFIEKFAVCDANFESVSRNEKIIDV